MMCRRLLLSSLLAALVVLGVGGLLVLWVQPRTVITRENAERIRVGMTMADVEAILGKCKEKMPAGAWFTLQENPTLPNTRVVYWGDRDRCVEVWFNDQLDVVVYRRDWEPSSRVPSLPPPNFFDKVLRWLGV